MQVNVMIEDGTVVRDGHGFVGLDLTTVVSSLGHTDLKALYWDGDSGELMPSDHLPNTPISGQRAFDTHIAPYLEVWQAAEELRVVRLDPFTDPDISDEQYKEQIVRSIKVGAQDRITSVLGADSLIDALIAQLNSQREAITLLRRGEENLTEEEKQRLTNVSAQGVAIDAIREASNIKEVGLRLLQTRKEVHDFDVDADWPATKGR